MSYYYTHYKIKWGDSIESIANKFKVNPSEICFYKEDDEFFVGQVLLIPITISNKKLIVTAKRTLEFYLNRQLGKRRYFKFYK